MPAPEFESPYFAAIDLGSNSFHMLVVRLGETRIEIVDREKEMVQIARGLKRDGSLDESAHTRALDCLKRFAERIRDIPQSQVRAVGTKTLRAARNTRAFLKMAEKALGVPIEIISGYEEARLVYTGLSHSVSNDGVKRLVVDIGGGSTEFVIGEGYSAVQLESLPLGCVSFSERFILRGGVNAKSMRKAYVAACAELEEIRKNFLKTGWELAYGTSGTMRAVADLLAERDGGAIITRKSLNQLVEETIANGAVRGDGLPKLRRDVLPAGLMIVQAIFDQLKLDTIHVADATLKEGLVYDNIGRFSNHDARAATVEALKQRYGIDLGQAERVRTTATALWRQIRSARLAGVSRTKILGWAAELYEVGLSVSHAGYHHHGHYILRHSDLAGFGRYEQYILANLVRNHRKKLSTARFEGLDQTAQQAFLPLLACLRIAVLLNRRREDIDVLPSLRYAGDSYTLSFQRDWLEARPLTLAGLEQETQYFAGIGLALHIEQQ